MVDHRSVTGIAIAGAFLVFAPASALSRYGGTYVIPRPTEDGWVRCSGGYRLGSSDLDQPILLEACRPRFSLHRTDSRHGSRRAAPRARRDWIPGYSDGLHKCWRLASSVSHMAGGGAAGCMRDLHMRLPPNTRLKLTARVD